jgi:hypothetical protein
MPSFAEAFNVPLCVKRIAALPRMVKKVEWIDMAQLAVFSILFEPLSLKLP